MRARTNLNFRIDRDLKKEFKAKTRKIGLSTCFILETLIRAWLISPPAIKESQLGASLTVNQKIEYLVERPRRRKGGGVIRGPLENCYFNGVWTYRKPETGEQLSELGHVSECVCSRCKPFVSLR